ncbi:MAG: glycosyltransferase family 2 protein [Thermoanaerobaculia bacterium]
MSQLISAVILAFNEEKNLPDCLESLATVASEIFVVDSGSTDGTREIAARFGANLVEHPFSNYSAQRNWAIDNLPLAGDWVLHLDADERLTPELAREIGEELPRVDAGVGGFLFRKRTVFLGRWIRHGGHYPSFHLRLLRKGKGRCEDRLYDQHFLVEGNVRAFRNDYLDVIASNLNVWTARHLRWADLEADEIELPPSSGARVAARLGAGPVAKRRWLRERAYLRGPLFVRAFAYFLYRYVVRLGFLDGTEGLIFHFLQGCWFRFLIDAKLFERRRAGSRQ